MPLYNDSTITTSIYGSSGEFVGKKTGLKLIFEMILLIMLVFELSFLSCRDNIFVEKCTMKENPCPAGTTHVLLT